MNEVTDMNALMAISLVLLFCVMLYLGAFGWWDSIIRTIKLWIKYYITFLIGAGLIIYASYPDLTRIGMGLLGLAFISVASSLYTEEKILKLNWKHIPQYEFYSTEWEDTND